MRDHHKLEYLQIGGGSKTKEQLLGHANFLNSKHVKADHVLGGNVGSPPIVLLMGCATNQARVRFENFVLAFDRAGAASVFGTTAPI